ncbi:alpha-amylase family glycosyl hydrolase [Streptomyces sp. PT12]|uniref:alpha-amylase family glycosyl hydrolase n=1 Tax=Streptomyces sp. PT12 TaxID=1510197 RepID=UPI00215C3600|nr:alpha-amylase family glycosyl hydrolase [Streptomyces sp. PT12]
MGAFDSPETAEPLTNLRAMRWEDDSMGSEQLRNCEALMIQMGADQLGMYLATPEQPDLSWAHPRVRQEHEDILRFWFDRGAAGIRIDSAALLAKAPDLPDFEPGRDPHPYVDRDELHDIYRSWRSVADAYDGVLIGELWLPDVKRFARYLRPDELHTAFNVDFLSRPWAPDELRASIDATLAAHAGAGAPATWVLCNHDVTRTVTRYGRAETGFAFAAKRFGTPTDLALGTRRARAAALLTLALPGAVYLYQGEDLGLVEAQIPRDRITDPMHRRSGGIDPGRDGCRVPLPWEGERPPYGFGGRDTWLPRPTDWAPYTAARQENDPDSMLSLYRTALRLRRGWADPGSQALTWLEGEPGLLAFARADGLICAVNLADEPVPLPAHTAVLLSSGPLDDAALLPADTAAWLRGCPAPRAPPTPTPHGRECHDRTTSSAAVASAPACGAHRRSVRGRPPRPPTSPHGPAPICLLSRRRRRTPSTTAP